MVCAAINRAGPGPASRMKSASSSRAHAGVAMKPSKVTVESMRRMNPIVEAAGPESARSRPTAKGRRFHSRSVGAARAKQTVQLMQSPEAAQPRSQPSQSARRVTRSSLGAKRLRSPKASAKASPRLSQRSRPNRSIPAQVMSE
jgi:hypothetical protein